MNLARTKSPIGRTGSKSILALTFDNRPVMAALEL